MLYIEATDAGTAHPSLKTEYLTLFGKYVGTLKGDGYYFVNPFCTAVNPAADTHLNQSGDVDNGAAKSALSLAFSSGRAEVNVPGKKKLSLKIMTLNNNRQKINDCLGNPVEIGIAVMWRVVDTAKCKFGQPLLKWQIKGKSRFRSDYPQSSMKPLQPGLKMIFAQ